MADEARGEPVDDPFVAHLHPNRGPGIFYGVLAALVLAVVLGGIATNLAGGHLISVVVIVVAGSALTGFLGLLSAAILGPALVVGGPGIVGRVSLRRRIDLGWDAISVDHAPDTPRGRFQLDLGVESFEVQPSSWAGFSDFVLVLASTTAALDRLTPAALDELVRLLDAHGPTTTADVPES